MSLGIINCPLLRHPAYPQNNFLNATAQVWEPHIHTSRVSHTFTPLEYESHTFTPLKYESHTFTPLKYESHTLTPNLIRTAFILEREREQRDRAQREGHLYGQPQPLSRDLQSTGLQTHKVNTYRANPYKGKLYSMKFTKWTDSSVQSNVCLCVCLFECLYAHVHTVWVCMYVCVI